jgi:predicted nucleic acid-binding Zn ribbon protein
VKRNSPTSRKTDATPLKECIDELLEVYKLKGRLNHAHVITSWEKIMGSPIAKRTSTIYFQDKKLFVKLTSAPLKQELSFSKSKILQMINADLGEKFVEDIVFI